MQRPVRLAILGLAAALLLPAAPASASAGSYTCSSGKILTTGKAKLGRTAYAKHRIVICYNPAKPYENEVIVQEVDQTDFAPLASASMSTVLTAQGVRVAGYAPFSIKESLETSVGGNTWYPQAKLQRGTRYTMRVTLTVDLARDNAGPKTTTASFSFRA